MRFPAGAAVRSAVTGGAAQGGMAQGPGGRTGSRPRGPSATSTLRVRRLEPSAFVPIETLDVLTGLLHRHRRTHDTPVAPGGRVGLHSGDARPVLVPRQRSRGGFGRGLLPVAGHGLPVSARGHRRAGFPGSGAARGSDPGVGGRIALPEPGRDSDHHRTSGRTRGQRQAPVVFGPAQAFR